MPDEQFSVDDADALLARATAGDEKAFDALFDLHRPALLRMIQLRMDARIRARVDPADVLQEAQVEVHRRLGEFAQRRPMPLALWLRKTAYEKLLVARRRHVQAQQRSVLREVALPEQSSAILVDQLFANDPSPSHQARTQEMIQRVQQVVAQLSEEDREILLMRNYEGLSNHEVSRLLEIEPSAASKRLGRALLRLRQLLVSDGYFAPE